MKSVDTSCCNSAAVRTSPALAIVAVRPEAHNQPDWLSDELIVAGSVIKKLLCCGFGSVAAPLLLLTMRHMLGTPACSRAACHLLALAAGCPLYLPVRSQPCPGVLLFLHVCYSRQLHTLIEDTLAFATLSGCAAELVSCLLARTRPMFVGI